MTRETRTEWVSRLSQLLRRAERPVRVLRGIAWPGSIRESFFAADARELPAPTYEPIDPTEPLALCAEVVREASGDSPVDQWLRRLADSIATCARMMQAVGTPAFHDRSRELYGDPTDPLPDETSHSLDLARQLDDTLSGLSRSELGAPLPACHLAAGVADEMRRVVADCFGERAPEVAVVDELSANCLAGPRMIRVRRSACFTDLDVHQLVHHEIYVHVATSLNGRDQVDLPILGAGHAGTTRTQEGLAVFAEYISGHIDPSRFRRLADRVLAIQMSIDGADFLDVYQFFLERTGGQREQAFENARRVFRGGAITGGAPFTKDVVYLDGLTRVHNFLRVAVAAGRTDCIRLLFSGKLDIEDVPALCELAHLGLLRPPTFMPPWIADLRYLVSTLAYSGFLNRVDLGKVRAHYDGLLAAAPVVAHAE